MGLADEIIKNKKKKESVADQIINGTYTSQTNNVSKAKRNNKKEKDKWYDEYFKESQGNGWQTFGYSALDALGNLTEGSLRAFEGISDWGRNRGADIVDFFGADDYAKKLRERSKEDDTASIVDAWNHITAGDLAGTKSEEEIGNFKKVEENSIFRDKADQVFQGVGNSLTSIGVGALSGGTLATPSFVMSAAGNAETEALNNGATAGEARMYGLISGAIEYGTEKMFGGLGKTSEKFGLGKGALDDQAVKLFTKNMKSSLMKNITTLGIKSVGEGLEEVASGIGNAFAQKITYMNEEEIGQLLKDQNLMDSFVSGMLSSALMQSPSTITSTVQGRDVNTGLTRTQQQYVNEIAQQRMVEAQRRNAKLNGYEKGKIEDRAITDFQKGRLIDNGKLPLRTQQAVNLPGLNAQTGAKVQSSVKGMDLQQSAYYYGFNPNSEVITTAKTMLDNRGIKSRFDADAFKNIDGNAYWTNNNGVREVVFNPNASEQAILEEIAIHELTHDLMSSKNSKGIIENQNIIDYVKTLDGYKESRAKLKKLYSTQTEGMSKKKADALINEEIIADTLGKNIGSQEYIRRLIDEEPSIAKNIYDWVVNKVANKNGVKNEKVYWNNVKNNFEKAYNMEYEGKGSESGAKYSIGGEKGFNNLTDSEKRSVKWYQDKNGDWKFEFTDKDMKLLEDLDDIKPGKEYTLNELFGHNLLTKMYPSLQEYKISFESLGNTNGRHNAEEKTIKINSRNLNYNKLSKNDVINAQKFGMNNYEYAKTQIEGTLLHELQHAIQNIEGFETGRKKGSFRKAYYESLGEIEANDTKLRYILERGGKLDRNKTAPESSKQNPVRRDINGKSSLEGYLKERKKHPTWIILDSLYDRYGIQIDKFREKAYNFFNKEGMSSEEIDLLVEEYQKEVLQKDSEKTIRNVVRRGSTLKGTSDSSFSNGETRYSLSENKGYHYGDLGKGNDTYYWNMSQTRRSTGHFGTGTYFFGSESASTTSMKSENRPLHEVDFSGYNLFKPSNTSEAIILHEGLKALNNIDRFVDYYDEFDRLQTMLKKYGISEQQSYEAFYNTRDVYFSDEYRNASYDSKLDSLSTIFMKELGYNGIDVRGIDKFDNGSYGSVIYDLDNKKTDIRYSLTDNQGRELTNEQQEYFKDSKVRDSEGNLKVLYNGSGNHTVYLPGYMSDESHWGKGIYLTPYKEIASEYGNDIKETYANITKPISYNTKMPFEQYNEFYKATYDGEEAYQEDYDMYDNDFDLLWDATNKGSWADYANELKQYTGYDGLIIDEIDGDRTSSMVIAFQSNQIKNVDNTNPTDNADIRYSLSETPTQDNKGRTLTKEQREYFKDSKVKDENGSLMTTYHGTTEEINVFKKDRLGSNTGAASAGQGFFFTSSKEVADAYSMYARPTYIKELEAKQEELKKIAEKERTNEAWNNYYRAYEEYEEAELDYGYGGRSDYENTKEVYLNITNPLIHDFKGEAYRDESYYDLLVQAQKNGNDGAIFLNTYDGYGDHDSWTNPKTNIYVVFDSNQIKNVDNITPTSDEDIRKSQQNEEWQSFLDNNFEAKGTKTRLSDIKLPGLTNTIQEEVQQQTSNALLPIANELRELNKNLNKVMNPTEISQLTPQDASTTPILPGINRNQVGDGRSSFFDNINNKVNMLNDEQKTAILNNDDVKYYDKVTNKDSLDKAFERLQENGQSESLRWFNKASENADATDVAEGWILLKQYADSGDTNGMVEVAKKLRDMGTKAGQTVQAFNILSRLTPEGMVKYAQSELLEAYDNMVKNKSAKWIEDNRSKFDLQPNEVQFIMDTMQEVSTMEDGYDKRFKLAQIQKVLTDKLPPAKGAGMKAWMRISMLFNPKTQVRNVAGNAVIAPVNAFGDMFASLADKVIGTKTGVRTTGNFNLKNYAQGMKTGLYQSYNDFKNGVNTRNIEGNRFEVTEGKSFNDNNVIGKALNRVDSLLSFMLDAGDRGFYEASFVNSINNQMVLNNTTEVTQEMIDIATQEALSRTWQDNNEYTKFVMNVRNGLNKLNIGGYGLGDVLIPFAKTPANLTKAIVEYSPAGLIGTINKGIKLNRSLTNGQYSAKTQHEFVQSLGKATAGTMLYILGIALANAGVTTGESDEDKDVSNFMKNTLGVNSYSIKIGDMSFTYDWAQPLAAPLAITANLVQKQKEEASLLENVVSTLDTAGNLLLEQSFMESISTVLNNNEGIATGMQEAILDLPARAIPTFLKQITDLTDGTQRQTFVKDKPIESMFNSMKAKIPGLSYTLDPSVDTLGRDIQKYGGKNNLFNVFLNPANVSTENVSESAQEIYRLHKETGETNIMPRVAPYYVNKKGEKIILTTQQRTQYQKVSGAIIEENVANLLGSTAYQNMSDTKKAETINDIVNYSYNIAQNQVLGTELSDTYQTAYEYAQIGDISDFYEFRNSIDDTDADTKKTSIVNYLYNSDLEDNQIANLYGNYYSSDKTINAMLELRIPIKEFIKFDSADIQGQYNSKTGQTISGSKKNATIEYVNTLNLSKAQRAILVKSVYSSYKNNDNDIVRYVNTLPGTANEKKVWLKSIGFDVYDDDVFNYINSQNISKDEKLKKLKELGFTVRDGRVYY